ncbi:MAG: PorT family protein [Bacteroidales bacterium]|nr:PorT family protein [Bacteroidales bacterium]
MKKITIILAALFFGTIAANAQNEPAQFSIRPSAGINITTYGGEDTDDVDPTVGMIAGVEAELGLTSNFGLSLGLNFAQFGCSGKMAEDGVSVAVDIKTNYFTMPVLANIYICKGLALKAGIQAGYYTNGEISAKTSGFKVGVNTDDYVEKLDFGIPVGLSYEFNGFTVDARYYHGLNKAFDEDLFEKVYNRGLSITFGYRISF